MPARAFEILSDSVRLPLAWPADVQALLDEHHLATWTDSRPAADEFVSGL